MKHEFDMADLGKVRYFLGLEVLQRSDGVFISQKKYALEVLKRFGMNNSNSIHNPIVPSYKLMKDEDGVKVDKTYYKQVVGSIMYLTATRPDMMFVVSLISRYMENPTELHLQATKRVMRYLKGTTGLGIFYRKGGDDNFFAYTDNDYAEDLDERTNSKFHGHKKTTNSKFIFHYDSSYAIKLSKNPIMHGRSKHIDVRFHFL